MEKERFIELMMEAEPEMFHIALSILRKEQNCSDAVQEAMVKAYANRHTLRNPAYFKTWVMRILINECYSLLRKQKWVVPMVEGMPDMQVDFKDYVREEYLDLYQAIDALKQKDRICVLLYYIEDYPVRQIAEILKMPEGTVKSRLRRARMQLKDMLKEREDRK